MDLHPGLVIGQSMRLSRRLGEGGMGTVWAAEHLSLGAEVAIKFLSTDLARDPTVRARFSAEASAAARIRSPHVVQVLEHGVFDDAPYIVMELLEGQDLAALLHGRGPLSLPESAEIVRQCAVALAEVHAHGVVHRDVKASNIFLTWPRGALTVKLLDFGIAKQLDGEDAVKTTTGMMVGTPAYLSPEQIHEPNRVDLRRDLWALSVVAYECLTGKMPFTGPSVGAIYIAIGACTYPPPSEHRPELGPEVDRWFARAFARRADDRFHTPEELSESLARLAGGASTGRLATPAIVVAGLPAAGPVSAGASTLDAPTMPLAVGRRSPARRGARVVGVVAALGAAAAVLAAVLLGPQDRDIPAAGVQISAAAAPVVPAPASVRPAAKAPSSAPEVVPAEPPAAPQPTAAASATALPSARPIPRTSPRAGKAPAPTLSKSGRGSKYDHGF